MPRVVHFEVCANNDNMERAAKFCTSIFGWKVDKWEGNNGSVYWPVNKGDEPEQGINGGLVQRHDPAHVTRIVLDVPSVDEFAAKITVEGGTQLVPKFAVPGVGYAAYFTDTEGNSFGIFEDDSTAA